MTADPGSSSTLMPLLAMTAFYILLGYVGIAVSVKRFHDRGKSGWWVLVGLIPIIGAFWLLIENGFLDGTPGDNQYGPPPGGSAVASTSGPAAAPMATPQDREFYLSTQAYNNPSPRKTGNIGMGILWMFIISVLLFWLPLFGGLIAGFVGGRQSGGIGNAILATLLPGILFGVLLFLISTSLSGAPLIGAIAGIGGTVLVLLHVGPLLVGAIIGGATKS